tara:strand:+ start:175 stop:468 length:294 start_codon:yes stop_codon:yes gene_type:complete
MKQTITENQFVDAIIGDDYNNMSYEGAQALFEYIEEYEDQTGEETELDVVAIRCEWTEYENIEEVSKDYDIDNLDDLRDNTSVIEVPKSDRLIVQEY